MVHKSIGANEDPKVPGAKKPKIGYKCLQLPIKLHFVVKVVGKSDKWLQLPKSAPTWFQNPTPPNQLQKSHSGPKVDVVRKAFTTQDSKKTEKLPAHGYKNSPSMSKNIVKLGSSILKICTEPK